MQPQIWGIKFCNPRNGVINFATPEMVVRSLLPQIWVRNVFDFLSPFFFFFFSLLRFHVLILKCFPRIVIYCKLIYSSLPLFIFYINIEFCALVALFNYRKLGGLHSLRSLLTTLAIHSYVRRLLAAMGVESLTVRWYVSGR